MTLSLYSSDSIESSNSKKIYADRGVHATGWMKSERWIFYGLVLLLIIPLWSFRYFPSQDGPMHLYNAEVLREYNRPDRSAFREYFLPNPKFVPNWLGPHLLPVLMQWLPANLAEKVLLTAYLVLFPLSIRYALIGIRPRARALSIAALPLVPNDFYHMGFHDFCLSLVGFFVAIGYFARRRERFQWRHGGVLAVILLCTYLTHLVSVGMVLPLLAICGVSEYWLRCDRIRTRLARSLPLAAAMVPVTGVTLFFMLGHHTNAMMHPWPQGWPHRFYFLLAWMKSYQFRDLIPATAILLTVAGLLLWLLQRSWRINSAHRTLIGLPGALLVITVLYFAIFLIAPDGAAGGQLLGIRLAAYPMFSALLYFAAAPVGPTTFHKMYRIAVGVAVPALLFLIISMCVSYQELNLYLSEFASIPPHIAPNSVMLPVHYEDYRNVAPGSAHRLAVGIDPFRHAAATGLAEKGIIDLGNYWATTDHQSLRWQPGLDPMVVGLDRLDNFMGWMQRTGKPIDYVLVWSGGLPHDELQGRFIASELRNYHLIFTSPMTGYLKLYQLSDPKIFAMQAAAIRPPRTQNRS